MAKGQISEGVHLARSRVKSESRRPEVAGHRIAELELEGAL